MAAASEGVRMAPYTIAVVHGDGIGEEVCRGAVAVLQAALGDTLRFVEYPAGAGHFRKTGESFPAASFEGCRTADAILHGAAGLPGVVHPDGTEAGLDFTLTLRARLDLFANVRPIKLYPGVVGPLRDVTAIDYVVVRENSEGLYASRGAGVLLRDDVTVDTLVQTRTGVERICRFAFELARTRSGAPADGCRRVTLCDKANVLRSYAFMRRVFDEIAHGYPDVEAEHVLVDAMTVHLVRRPGHYDVIVTENMFGDIISDLAAATIGGMGMAPSAELGADHGFFQASHGTAPDIAGRGIANPYGTVLAAAAMLAWLGKRHEDARLTGAAAAIERAVETVVAEPGGLTADLGGAATSAAIVAALCERVSNEGRPS